MPTIDDLLEEVYSRQERLTRDEIQRRAVAADLSADDLTTIDALPEGEYTQDEVVEAIGQRGAFPGAASRDALDDGGVLDDEAVLDPVDLDPEADVDEGVPPDQLTDDDLVRELASLHRTRHETFLHASAQALQHHSERSTALELEYLRRRPGRDVDPDRLRAGARERP